MKPPNEIVADAVRDELYARKAFAALILRPAREFRAAVENDPPAQTEFMARYIVDYYDNRHKTIRPEHGLDLLTAARLAARHGEPHLRCRIEKTIANVLRFLGRFSDAAEALQLAEGHARQTSARLAHNALVEFGRVALCFDTDRYDEAAAHARNARSDFETAGAHDRAHSVSLYVACIQGRIGHHFQALATFLDAARYARKRGSAEELGEAYYNIGHCYRSLCDFDRASTYVRK